MNTLNFLDSNVWLALIWSRHVHPKGPVPGSRKQRSNNSFSAVSLSSLSFACSQPNPSWQKETKTMSEAWALWDRVWADPRIAFLPEPDRLEKEFSFAFEDFQPISQALGRCLPSRLRSRLRLEIRHL